MLRVSVQKKAEGTVFQCSGRIVIGEEAMLLKIAVLSRSAPGALLLDLAEVEHIDAGGLGLLLDLIGKTRSKGIQIKLVNLTRRVLELFELTHLDRVLEIAAPSDSFQLRAGHPLPCCQSANTATAL